MGVVAFALLEVTCVLVLKGQREIPRQATGTLQLETDSLKRIPGTLNIETISLLKGLSIVRFLVHWWEGIYA